MKTLHTVSFFILASHVISLSLPFSVRQSQLSHSSLEGFKQKSSSPTTRIYSVSHDGEFGNERLSESLRKCMATASLMFTVLASSSFAPPAFAVSGGGLDYANLDLTAQDFSNGNYKGKDFTQIIAKGTTFEGSNLIGCRFYKAYLVNTNFKGADLRGASLEDTSMDGADLTNVNAVGAYFSASLLDAKSIEGADFTDAQLPPKLLARICARENFATGTNPSTGVETRESLMCP